MHTTNPDPFPKPNAMRAGFVCAGILLVLFGVLSLGVLSGCSATSRTRVDPASTNATHSVVEQNAGRTKTKTIELRIDPAGSDATKTPANSTEPADDAGRRGAGAAVASPSGWDDPNWVQSAGAAVQNTGMMQAVAWSGNRVRDQPRTSVDEDADSLADAIRSAVEQGARVEFKLTETDNTPLTTDTIESTLDDRGAGLQTSSDEAAIGFEGGRGKASLPYGGRSGKSSFGLDATMLTRGTNWLIYLGGFVLLFAIAPILITPRRPVAAAVIAGMGLLLIAAGVVATEYPWVFAIVIVIALIGVAWIGYEFWKRGAVQHAFDAVVKGVDDTNMHHQSVVKDSIAEAAGNRISVVRAEVTKSKNKQGIKKTGTTG